MTLLATLLLFTVPAQADELCAMSVFPDDMRPADIDAAQLDTVIGQRPGCMAAHFLRGFAMLDDASNDKEGALGHFERALALAPDHSQILFWLGQTHGALASEQSSLSHALKCRDYLQRAIDADPENLDARSVLAGYHRNAPWIAGGRIKVAYEQAREIRKRDLKRGLLEQARTLFADDKESEAIDLARSSLQEFPNHVPLAIEYAVLMHGRKDFAEAHRVLAAIAGNEDADPNVLYQLGRTAALSGEFLKDGRDALTRYLQRVEADPGLPYSPAAAWWRLGMIEQHASQLAAARTAFERALDLDPELEDAAKALRALPE